MTSPGMLYVTMQPKPGLPLAQFHEWYDNEHGPTRLRLPQIFTSGLRYRAIDGPFSASKPEYLAAYDVTRMSELETETYLALRANRSPREAETIGQVDVKRYFWDLAASVHAVPGFVAPEYQTNEDALGTVLEAVEFTSPKASAEETQAWFDKELAAMLAKIPGWLRSRLMRTSSLETGVAAPSFLLLTEYSKTNGLGGVEHTATVSSLPSFAGTDAVVARRTYSLFYVFGPAPRDLENLAQLPTTQALWTAPDGRTTTTNASLPAPSSAPAAATTTQLLETDNTGPVLSSYVTTSDSLEIPYRLEGNTSPDAPVIAFCNSLLTSLHMWDPFIAILKHERPAYRILRYDVRGRHSVPGSPPSPATLDMVSDDLAHLMKCLRIPQLEALVGVSMGGATTTKFALKFGKDKVKKFVACDYNVTSSAANTEAWKGRIAVAESEPENGVPGIRKLAERTVGRWFHPDTMTEQADLTVKWMQDMVAANDVTGFRYGCQALWDYDMKPQMASCQVPGLLVVGEGDGKGALVKAMEGFKGLLGKGDTALKIVPKAGHLPMCENPLGFWDAVKEFL